MAKKRRNRRGTTAAVIAGLASSSCFGFNPGNYTLPPSDDLALPAMAVKIDRNSLYIGLGTPSLDAEFTPTLLLDGGSESLVLAKRVHFGTSPYDPDIRRELEGVSIDATERIVSVLYQYGTSRHEYEVPVVSAAWVTTMLGLPNPNAGRVEVILKPHQMTRSLASSDFPHPDRLEVEESYALDRGVLRQQYTGRFLGATIPLQPTAVRCKDDLVFEGRRCSAGESIRAGEPARARRAELEGQEALVWRDPGEVDPAEEILVRELGRIMGLPRPADASGELRLRMSRRKRHDVSMAYIVPTVLSLSLLNVLGLPFASQTAEVTLAAEIRNARDEVVWSYTAEGSATEYAAYYYGYSGVGAATLYGVTLSKATVAASVLDALSQIVGRLREDAGAIRAGLDR